MTVRALDLRTAAGQVISTADTATAAWQGQWPWPSESPGICCTAHK